MKKIISLFAAVMLLASSSFAQDNARRIPVGKKARTHKVMLNRTHSVATTTTTTSNKAVGDTIATFPWTEDFETGVLPAGFTVIDADNDTYTWDPTFLFSDTTNYGHNESHGMISSASYINDIGAITPDNWMILPSMELPATVGLVLSWYEKGQDLSYCAEKYSLYIATGERTTANFLATTPVLTSITTNGWVKKSVDLSPYIGQTINIAFRHYDVTDMFWLDIDDIRIGEPEAPELNIVGPTTIETGDTAIFTAEGVAGSTLTWNVTADYTFEQGYTIAAVWNTPGNYTVMATAANNNGTSYDTIEVEVITCDPITSFPFTENFEGDIPCWKMVLGDPNNSNSFGIEESEDAYEGENVFVFSSYDQANDYNQYLITPEIQLPATNQFMIKFYYMATSTVESFKVMVSTTNSDLSSFTQVIGDIENTVDDEEYHEVAFSLPNNTKYICINYYADYVYDLYIDELSIESLSAPNVELAGPEEIGTGNEAVFTATSPLAESYEWKVDGTTVPGTDNTLSYIFTTANQHTVTVIATNSIGSSEPVSMSVNVFDCDDITLPYIPDFSNGLRCWTSTSYEEDNTGWYASIDLFESDPVGQVLSFSAENVFGMFMSDLDVDNWLTSPIITMPSTGSYEISWKVMPYATDYPTDHYGVYVITEGAEPTLLFEETLNSTMGDFQQRIVAIPSSVNGDFRVAFRHYDNPGGGYVIILDNIRIVEAGSTQGIDDVENNSVAIYPNPANSIINVEGEGIITVQLLDMNGRTVITRDNRGMVDISGLANGIYMVRVITENGVSTQKIVKK